ncbi:MAG TPA: alkaline phosphatase family protein [bacterium]|nr:alkaline phosphatase family protein [bacterium]
MADKQLVFIDIDGLDPGVLYDLIDDGSTNISKLAQKCLRVEKASTVFPAVTLSCQASMFTGVFPAGHGIVGNSWFDRHSDQPVYRRYTTAKTAAGTYGFGLFGFPTIILPERPELQYANNDLSTNIRTVYEMAHDKDIESWQVFNHYSRGVDRWIKPTRPEMILFALCHEELIHNRKWDKATFNHLFRIMKTEGRIPPFLVFYISGLDNHSHQYGPETQKPYFKEVLDPLFGDLIRNLESFRPLDEINFIITSDHRQATTIREKEYVIRMEYLSEIMDSVPGGYSLFDKKEVRDGDTAVICTESGTAQIHLMNRRTRKWQDKPGFEEDVIPVAETFEKHKSGDLPFVDIILVRPEFKADYQVYDGGKLVSTDEYFDGKDNEYPDAVRRIKGINCDRSGDLIVLLDYSKGYYYGDKLKAGEHGNLHEVDSLIPLVVSGPGVKETTLPRAGIVDAVPTAAKILGFDAGDVDGVSLI